MNLASWNVRTLLQPGKMAEVAQECDKYNMDVVALQEVRWPRSGQIDKRKYSLCYSGTEWRSGRMGVGFWISAKTRRSLLYFEAAGERICRIRLKGRFRNITLISAYAPTEEATEEEKNTFYDNLGKLCEKIPKYDMRIILGDFNAQIGKEDFLKNVAGKQTLQEVTNENGKRLAQLAAEQDLLLSSTMFKHKKIHKGTWKMPGSNIVNQIDHVLVSKRQATSILDVKSQRGPNCDSDHYLVSVKMKERIALVENRQGEKRKKWDIDQLKNEVNRQNYQEKLNANLVNVAEEEGGIDQRWMGIRDAVLKASEDTVGERKRKRNGEWFDVECAVVIEEKNKDRLLMLQRNTRQNAEVYKESRKKAKKLIRRKKRLFMKQEMNRIESLRGQNETRKFYQAVRVMGKGFQPRTNICKDRDGNALLEEEKILNRWAEYFEELSNGDGAGYSRWEPKYQTAEIEIQTPTVEEVEWAVARQKSQKASGVDSIPAEMWKHGGEQLLKVLHRLIVEIWTQETLPKDWTSGLICPIYKKGDKQICGNYRGITLLNVAYKIFSSLVLQRLSTFTEEVISEYQCGFRPGRATTDQLFAIRQTMEKCFEYNTELHMLFIDFSQAFDSVDRIKLLDILESFGVPRKLIRLTHTTLTDCNAKVTVGGKTSRTFPVEKGVRQGDVLSAILFNLTLEKAMRNVDLRGNIIFRSRQAHAYADDIALVARNMETLMEMFQTVETEGQELGLKVNESKTKYMLMSQRRPRRTEDVRFGDYTFENVERFNYLGSELNVENKISQEINRRIVIGNKAYYANVKLLKSKLLSHKTKLQIYKTLVRPTVTYGCEAWTLTLEDVNALRILERKIVRKIYGPVREAAEWRIRNNSEINHILNNEDVVRFIKARRLSWLGHVIRMPPARLQKQLLEGKMEGTRRRGRPRRRWLQEVTDDLTRMGIRNWRRLASERREWGRIVEEAKVHLGL